MCSTCQRTAAVVIASLMQGGKICCSVIALETKWQMMLCLPVHAGPPARPDLSHLKLSFCAAPCCAVGEPGDSSYLCRTWASYDYIYSKTPPG